jgi:phospholipase D1/2
MASHVVHGILESTIFQARLLSTLLGKVGDEVKEALQLQWHSGLYATIDIGIARIARTRVLPREPANAIWNETFHTHCAYTSPSLVISIKKELELSAEVVGRAKIPTSEILSGKVIEGWFDLYNEDFSEKLKKAQIHVRLQFTRVSDDPYWGTGIRDRDFPGVQHVYFKQRNGCRVDLYQNSHLSEQYSPRIELGDGEEKALYRPPRLWEELYQYIDGAEQFIYIAGWSVNTKTMLVRDEERMIPGAEGVTLGELLKKKADQGVRVLILIWEDRTAVEFLRNQGLMKTHGDETFEYFKGTNVNCFLCPRLADHSLSLVQSVEIAAEFTHHQKTVSLDARIQGSENRQVVSFVGGIDLCDGRYDNEIHPLYRTLNTVYRDDFRQNNYKYADIRHGGPREPWHDAHSKIQGPAAYDVVTNFTQRWMKQADPTLLLNLGDLPGLQSPSAHFEGPEAWNVQIFRSIDDASVVGFPANPSDASELGLVTVKDQVIDKSIQCAYIEAIRRARDFIYIENQYFFGSCASWDRDQDCECLHLIPMEITLKVVSKIRARERFAVYVVTPMWPEGIPEGDTVQAILHWFRNTARMMYQTIGETLREEGLDQEFHPTDFLNFFCLGNREVKLPGEYEPPERPEKGSDYWNAQMHRRTMIYVHAKLMIVDDEYIIIGSANLNQRSMDGARDSEIAQGCYQPQHINEQGRRARGEIFGYRMSLWYEHFAQKNGGLRREYLHPESVECVRMVRRIGEGTWESFVEEENVEDLPGHLMAFPMEVLKDGSLDEEEGIVFPDTKASVKGNKSDVLPPILTT